MKRVAVSGSTQTIDDALRGLLDSAAHANFDPGEVRAADVSLALDLAAAAEKVQSTSYDKDHLVEVVDVIASGRELTARLSPSEMAFLMQDVQRMANNAAFSLNDSTLTSSVAGIVSRVALAQPFERTSSANDPNLTAAMVLAGSAAAGAGKTVRWGDVVPADLSAAVSLSSHNSAPLENIVSSRLAEMNPIAETVDRRRAAAFAESREALPGAKLDEAPMTSKPSFGPEM
ncbi:hypothetical protein A3709_20650 [Halioglobus sp. HI00S01]|uniref:hypothetical protein n=1 Tax=Halioglobus sp. HI00S01 TaxID=1822214 RepID=UPI0007C29D8C|nr:hypothetical protein [Halioglobus sp. HI00S01]KZX58024.1 hypothetical protein A3709_20650 [Halioglobus sp. HI00S01]